MWPCVMQTIVAGQGEVGAAADVEADVELGDLHDGFFARHAVADDVVSAPAGAWRILNQKRFLSHAGRSVVRG